MRRAPVEQLPRWDVSFLLIDVVFRNGNVTTGSVLGQADRCGSVPVTVGTHSMGMTSQFVTRMAPVPYNPTVVEDQAHTVVRRPWRRTVRVVFLRGSNMYASEQDAEERPQEPHHWKRVPHTEEHARRSTSAAQQSSLSSRRRRSKTLTANSRVARDNLAVFLPSRFYFLFWLFFFHNFRWRSPAISFRRVGFPPTP